MSTTPKSGKKATSNAKRVSSGKRYPISTTTPANPYLDLINQYLDSNPLIPAGMTLANIRSHYVPVYDENLQVHLVCARGVACDRNLTIDGQKVTCRDGSSRCKHNHKRMCRYSIQGKYCRFHHKGSCEHPHYTLWSPSTTSSSSPLVVDKLQFPELSSTPGAFALTSSCSCADAQCEHTTSAPEHLGSFLDIAKASAHLPQPKSAPKPTLVKRAKPGKCTQLCKFAKEECRHARHGRCTFAHSLDELVLVPEVQQIMEIVEHPDKHPQVFQDIADEVYRVLTSSQIDKFIEMDKSTAHKAHQLPCSTNLGETLEMWKIYASRARQMKSGKLPPPVGFSIDDIPDFTLFPEDGFENQKEAICWTLANNQYQCQREDCKWGYNCRNGFHLVPDVVFQPYAFNFKHLSGKSNKDFIKAIDEAEATRTNSIQCISNLEKQRKELKHFY